MYLLFYFILFSNLVEYNGLFTRFHNATKHKILHSAILGFMPNVKLHHIVVMQPPSLINKNDAFAIDFTPLNQGSLITLLKLFFAINVPGETRLRLVKNGGKMNDTEFIEAWHKNNPTDPVESKKMSDQIYSSIQSKPMNEFMKQILHSVSAWDTNMNVYSHNCQHFAAYLSNEIEMQNIL